MFQRYTSHIEDLPKNTETEFEKIANLIRLHAQIAEEHPRNALLILSHCPSRLVLKKHSCRDILEKQQEMVSSYIRECLEAGNARKEFDAHPVDDMTLVLLCLVNEFMRMKTLKGQEHQPDAQGAIEFCRSAIMSPRS